MFLHPLACYQYIYYLYMIGWQLNIHCQAEWISIVVVFTGLDDNQKSNAGPEWWPFLDFSMNAGLSWTSILQICCRACLPSHYPNSCWRIFLHNTKYYIRWHTFMLRNHNIHVKHLLAYLHGGLIQTPNLWWHKIGECNVDVVQPYPHLHNNVWRTNKIMACCSNMWVMLLHQRKIHQYTTRPLQLLCHKTNNSLQGR